VSWAAPVVALRPVSGADEEQQRRQPVLSRRLA